MTDDSENSSKELRCLEQSRCRTRIGKRFDQRYALWPTFWNRSQRSRSECRRARGLYLWAPNGSALNAHSFLGTASDSFANPSIVFC